MSAARPRVVVVGGGLAGTEAGRVSADPTWARSDRLITAPPAETPSPRPDGTSPSAGRTFPSR